MVSVIIPIYNIESVLTKCVESVLHQTYRQLEVILVDDGSTDGSGALCDKFSEMDSRVKVFHKQNGGLSDARNYGLAHSHGDYVLYLDGDDWMDNQAIAVMRDKADKYDADFVQSGYYYAYPEYLLGRKELLPEQILSKEQALKELLSDGLVKNFAWGNLLKRDLAAKVLFVKGKYYEDIYWKYKIIDFSNKIVYLSQPMFYYRQRSCSISAAFSMKNMDLLEGSRLRLEFIKVKYPQLSTLALRTHWLLAFHFMKIGQYSKGNLVDKYKSYFETFNKVYRPHLDVAMKENNRLRILYLIYNNFEFLYPVYNLVIRIQGHFGRAVYKKFCYQD